MRWWLPSPVYESLPVMYLAGGILSLLTLEASSGRLGGVLLLVASWLIHGARSAYRAGTMQRHDRLVARGRDS